MEDVRSVLGPMSAKFEYYYPGSDGINCARYGTFTMGGYKAEGESFPMPYVDYDVASMQWLTDFAAEVRKFQGPITIVWRTLPTEIHLHESNPSGVVQIYSRFSVVPGNAAVVSDEMRCALGDVM